MLGLLLFAVSAFRFIALSVGKVPRFDSDFRQKYEDYVQCLGDRMSRLRNQSGTEMFDAKLFVRHASITLHCFECLTPWEEEELQDKWKPTESFIGRRINQFVRKLKKPLNKAKGHLKSTASRPNEDEKWVFAWEFMPMKTKSAWRSVLDLREPRDSFITRDAKRVEVNNRYDLEIREAEASDSGWYRCVKRSAKGEAQILRAYFVDVLNELPVTVEQYDRSDRADPEFTHSLVEVFARATEWTQCNQCASDAKRGEQHRRVMCYIKARANVDLAQSEWSVLQFFEHIPCRSSLVPLSWRAKLWARHAHEEFRECTDTCQVVARKTRIVNETDDAGKSFVSDVLPPDEFALSERLPSLRASVVRKTVRAAQSDPLVLDCASGLTGIQWRKDYRNLDSVGLLKGYGERIYVNADNQLVISALELEDDGLYSCFAVPRTVMRTFRVYVREDTRSRDLVVVAQMMIRFAALTLFVILVITTVLSANTHAERHRHANS